MEEVLNNIISSGPVGVVAAAIVYLVIALQRNSTKKSRDNVAEEFDKRISLLEADNKNLHTQIDTIGNKLDTITEILTDIRIELANKKDRE